MTAPTTTEPSLRARIRRIAEQSATADPKTIADEVLATISTAEAIEALTECLPEFVRIQLHHYSANRPPRAGKPRSWKLEGARLYAEKLLRQRVDISGKGTSWKFLAECDAGELSQLASLRRRQADELVETATWYEKIAGLLDEHGADTVANLPEPVLLSLATNGEMQP